MMKRHCLALDLKDDAALLARYDAHHRAVWPDVLAALRRAGVQAMELYRIGVRLIMIIDVDETFSFERKAEIDRNDPAVVRWEAMMTEFQAPGLEGDPWAKWRQGELVFSLNEQLPAPTQTGVGQI